MSKPLNVFEVPLSGFSLVEASAGTGKTYNITSLYVRAILEMGLLPSQILVMTYTDAATAELKFRLRNRLRESLKTFQGQNPENDSFLTALLEQSYENAAAKLKAAIDTFDEASVFTIHGFCSRLLTEYSLQFDVSPDFELLADYSELLQDCVDDYWRSFVAKAEEDEHHLILLDYLTDDGFGPDELKQTLDKVLTHPYAKVEPSDISLEELYDLLPELKSKFNNLKECWEKNRAQLDEIYHSGKLNGTYFREGHSKQKDWVDLLDLVSRSIPKIGISSDRMPRLGTYMQEKGSTKKFTVPELDFFPALDEYVNIAERLKLLKPAFVKESIEEVRNVFETQKSSSNLLTYNDLLESVEKGIRGDKTGYLVKTLSNKYPLALVDEFQDTDPVQYGIFKQIYEEKKDKALFMIGDPKQAIYGFRGADIFTYLDAKSDAGDDQSYTLGENYRSNEKMIKGVNEFFGQSELPFQIEQLNFNPVSFPDRMDDIEYILDASGNPITPFQSIIIDNDSASKKDDFNNLIYDAVTDEIIELLSGGYTVKGEKIREEDIAILVRSGFQGEEIQSRLRNHGLKSVLKSRTSVFQVRESDELFVVLKAVQNIRSEQGIRAALVTEMLGYSAADIQNLLTNEAEWSTVIEKFISIKEEWDNKGIDAAIEEIFKRFKCFEILALKKDAERRITNLMHLSELLDKTERQERLYGKALLKWFYQKKNEENTEADEEQLRLESDEKLIQISTIHAAKGLQYRIVFCPFLWNAAKKIKKGEVFSFYRDGNIHVDISQSVTHHKKEDFKTLSEEQQLAEEVRLAYVALTRSVSACYLFIPNFKDVSTSAIAFILGRDKRDSNFTFEKISEVLADCEFIKVRTPVEGKPADFELNAEAKTPDLKVREMRRNDLFRFPRMLSYSSLAEGKDHSENPHDYDSVYEFYEKEAVTFDKYGFPKGATAGTCLHKIFEDIQFSNPKSVSEAVIQNLDYYGFSKSWENPTEQWVYSVLTHSLNEEGMMFSKLMESNVLKEMEFYFPTGQIKVNELWKMIRGESPFMKDNESVFGFLKGFIDLIFKYEDRFYILDYKSNHLGNSPEDYSKSNLNQAILDAGYDLQYHIYTLALHRYLEQRIKGYNYEQHFGGVMYLFLRGVEPDQSGSGVFFDRPDLALIRSMDKYFRQGGSK